MESVPPSTGDTLSAAAIAQQTQQCLDELQGLALGNPESPPKVLLCIGRPGTGKSSFVEDVSGVRGYSQQSLDPVTQRCELARVMIGDKPCFIMDTPGFDPAHGEAIFREIVRGIQTILSISRIAGFLYFTCINQPRLDSFDHQVFRLSRALAGDDYLPCVTFITTFWTTDQPSQQANFNSQLERLKHTWRQAFGVQELHCYQHGRGYNAAWEPTDAFINWFDVPGRNQIAQHAKEMIARRYCGPGASAEEARTPKIVQELTRGIPIHETDAGRSLELRLAHSDRRPMPASIEQHREGPHQQSSSATSDANAGPSRDEGHHTGSQDIRTRQDAPGSPQAPENPWYMKLRDTFSPFFPNNVNFSFNVSGPVGGMGGPRGFMTSSMGPRSQGMSFDPLSSVDVLKANGFDSSREGRLRYAAEHGIGGQPFSAEWGEAIRQDVLRRNR